MKKLRKEKKERKLQDDTALKASLTVGVGPITKETLKYFEETNNDEDKAREAAVREFLNFYLKYSDEELEELEIMATQQSQKDDVVYIAFSNVTDVRNIYGRAAICKNKEVITRQLWYHHSSSTGTCTCRKNVPRQGKIAEIH